MTEGREPLTARTRVEERYARKPLTARTRAADRTYANCYPHACDLLTARP